MMELEKAGFFFCKITRPAPQPYACLCKMPKLERGIRNAYKLQSNLNQSNLLGPWKFVRGMGSSSHWGQIIAPGQEANDDNLGIRDCFSIFKTIMLCWVYSLESPRGDSNEYTQHTISW